MLLRAPFCIIFSRYSWFIAEGELFCEAFAAPVRFGDVLASD